MSTWNDPIAWQAQLDGSNCPICVRGNPLHVISTLESAWLAMSEEAPMPGYLCLVSRVHVVELHDLSEKQAEAFVRDVRRVSHALSIASQAVKLNYEIHGNTLPHLHMHFFPRYKGDPFEGRPIDPKGVRQPVYAAGEFSRLRDRILRTLTDSAGR